MPEGGKGKCQTLPCLSSSCLIYCPLHTALKMPYGIIRPVCQVHSYTIRGKDHYTKKRREFQGNGNKRPRRPKDSKTFFIEGLTQFCAGWLALTPETNCFPTTSLPRTRTSLGQRRSLMSRLETFFCAPHPQHISEMKLIIRDESAKSIGANARVVGNMSWRFEKCLTKAEGTLMKSCGGGGGEGKKKKEKQASFVVFFKIILFIITWIQ
jgi:hypothetical protein